MWSNQGLSGLGQTTRAAGLGQARFWLDQVKPGASWIRSN
jgi:hypothetical protein